MHFPLQGLHAAKLRDLLGQDERVRQVRVATAIGVIVGVLFAIFNVMTDGMRLLGVIELGAVLFLVLPAMALSTRAQHVERSETLLLLAAMLIFGALIVLGGVAGTGLFWVYTLPFLAFFLKGQRLGWRYSLAFLACATVYLLWFVPAVPVAYTHPPVVVGHFLLSLGFYTLVAAAFNYVRTRYENQLLQAKERAEVACQELRLAQEKTEAAYAAKSRFFSAASHDLRQPAHALGMFVARLNQLPKDPSSAELVAGVDASVRALQDMLNMFFDYSRLDALSSSVTLRPVQVEAVFAQLRLFFTSLAAQKGVRLRLRPSSYWVQSDPVLLQRVLLNLVGNALQYTHSGSILISCRPGPGPTQARIEVRDSGIGIATQHHEKIFEEFFQVHNQERDRSKGLGLGLSMVARSCTLLGHGIALRSGLGCGSRFTLTLTLAESGQTARAPAAVTPACAGTQAHQHILLIEDDALGRQALQGLLQSWGYHVSVARDAASACALLRDKPAPDFVISDYRLPGPHHGIDAIHMLRAACAQPVAACLISGDTGTDIRQQTQAAQLTLLQKPVSPAKLRSLLRRALLDKQPGSPA